MFDVTLLNEHHSHVQYYVLGYSDDELVVIWREKRCVVFPHWLLSTAVHLCPFPQLWPSACGLHCSNSPNEKRSTLNSCTNRACDSVALKSVTGTWCPGSRVEPWWTSAQHCQLSRYPWTAVQEGHKTKHVKWFQHKQNMTKHPKKQHKKW